MLGVYNYRTMEAKARQIISKYCPECMYGDKAVPIEWLAENIFGLEIEYQYLTKKGDKVLGKLICRDGITPYYDMDERKYMFLKVCEKTILIEARLLEQGNQGRYRFTLAHELAHWILHRERIIEEQTEAAFTELSSDTKMEQQADYMASAILMPMGAVKRYYHSLFGKSLTKYEMLLQMADHFVVSKQAMQIRLQSHNLI